MSETFRVLEVNGKKDATAFHRVPFAINHGNPNWIAPLKQDVEKVFDRKVNPLFSTGDAARWLLVNERNEVQGRIAAFISDSYSHAEAQPTGGCGFFECVNNERASATLFNTARNWLQERGMQAMDGPINFGERNSFWGCLAKGFSPPVYQMNYNPPYYPALFESFGFGEYYRQNSYRIYCNDERPERYKSIVQRLMRSGDYSFRHIRFSEIEKYAADLCTVFNKAWAHIRHSQQMTLEEAQTLIRNMKPVLVEHLCWFGYYKEEPVAIFVMLPELNQWFRHCNGNFNWWGKLKFLWHKTFTPNRHIYGLLFGVVPEHQRKGVEAAIVLSADAVVRPLQLYDEMELVWVGDFNHRMIQTVETLGGQLVKQHITYRYLFNRSAPFQRHPVID